MAQTLHTHDLYPSRLAFYFDGIYNHLVYKNLEQSDGNPRLNYATVIRLIEYIVSQANFRAARMTEAHWFQGVSQVIESIEAPILSFAAESGVSLHIRSVSNAGKEVGIDTGLTAHALRLAHLKLCDILVILTGDSDFIPLIQEANAIGVPVVVANWTLPDSTSGSRSRASVELGANASLHIPLEDLASGDEATLNQWRIPTRLIYDLFEPKAPLSVGEYAELFEQSQSTVEPEAAEPVASEQPGYSPNLPRLGEMGVRGRVVNIVISTLQSQYIAWIRPNSILPHEGNENNIPHFISMSDTKALVPGKGMEVEFDVSPIASRRKHGLVAISVRPVTDGIPRPPLRLMRPSGV